VASRRTGAYRSEVPLSGSYESLTVRGRADGYDASRALLEEVKTFKGDLARVPANHRALHWAQAKVYGWLLCQQFTLAELDVSVVYFDVVTEVETPFVERCSAEVLRQHFETLCRRFIDWARREVEHRCERDADLSKLAFPHAGFRGGQRTLAENAFRAAALGRCLMTQAPTGIGKTVGTIFALLKAAPVHRLDKVYFLTAKRSGRAVALDAIQTLYRARPSAPLRVLELVSRERACEHSEKACHGDSCSLAKGFYDRLPAAREEAVALATLPKEVVRRVALAHEVCPYYLGQELVRWADVVVGDYNHYFDSSALLHGLAKLNEWRVAVLVDEAHNLVDRARAMYSAELSSSALRKVTRTAPKMLKTPLRRIERAWHELSRAQEERYEVLDELPETLVSALRAGTSAISDFMAEQPAAPDPDLLEFYFRALQFGKLAETFGPHSIVDVSLTAPDRRGRIESIVCIRNVLPAPFLRPRFETARTSVLFSATLAPERFYADMLGLPADTAWLDVEAPFAAEQLTVRIVDQVSTRYARRGDSLAPIATLMAAQYAQAPGNYLAFFSSFDYLRQALDEFSARYPDVPTWHQSRQMHERAREDFLARFEPGGAGIAFAVLGGSFAEGIDLPGTRLVGAFIATLGLPQSNPVNEEMRRSMEAAFGSGYEYTYLFPGIRKVVQAAGRVIRTPTDKGHLFLIDDRFGRPEVKRLLPAWWRVEASQRSSRAKSCGARRPCPSRV
jgi:Rad3-related DNA helicase